MKKYLYLAAICGSLNSPPALITSIGVVALTTVACKTTQTVAFSGVTALQTEIASTRVKWADYVIAHRIEIGKIVDVSTQSTALLALNAKEARVKAALDNYQTEAKAAKAANDVLPAGTTPPVPVAFIAAGTAYLTTVSSEMK